MILFKSALVTKIRTCICGLDYSHEVHHYQGELVPRLICTGHFTGQKTMTRRFWTAPRVKVGSVHRVNIDYRRWTGMSIKILSVGIDFRLDMISEDDARAEGFESAAAFQAYFDTINAKRDIAGRKCYVVTFEIASPA